MIRRDIILKLFHNENSHVKLLKNFINRLYKSTKSILFKNSNYQYFLIVVD